MEIKPFNYFSNTLPLYSFVKHDKSHLLFIKNELLYRWWTVFYF